MPHQGSRTIEGRGDRTAGARLYRRRRTLLLHRALVAYVAVSLVFLAPGGIAPVHAQPSSDAAMTTDATLDRLESALDAVRTGLDATRFDLGALGLALAFEDPSAITAYVRDAVAFEPYAGVLRGAEGALRSRGGNAHDQALLLATLLRDAGYDARIVLGHLPLQDAKHLVAGAFERPPSTGIESTPAWQALADLASWAPGGEAAYAMLEERSRGQPASGAPTEQARVAEEALVAAIGVDRFGGADAIATIVEEARDYAWVEYRALDTGEWTALHPAWRAGELPTSLVGESVLDGPVPEALQHRVRFRAFVERRVGDRLEVHPLMAAWERPVATAADRAYTFATVPIDSSAFTRALAAPIGVDPVAVDLAPALAAATFFVPMFDGAPADGASAFDLEGNVAPLDAAADPAAGVFRTVANATNRAASALGALGSDADPADDPAIALTALFYETTLIAPGGAERTERRYLIDRVGAANRARGATDLDGDFEAHDVLTAVTWSVHHGRVHEGWYLGLVVDRLLEARPIVERLVDDTIAGRPSSPEDVAALLADLEDAGASAATLEHLELALRFEEPPSLERDTVAFRPSPAMIAIERGFTSHAHADGSVVRISTDIQANPRRVLRRGPEGVAEVAALEALRIGVWETAMERSFALDAASVGSLMTVESVFEAFEGSVDGPRVIQTSAEVARLGNDFGAATLAAMARDVERGYVLVVPTGRASAVDAWWRVDPTTGETLGMANDGRGQTMVEYLVAKGFSLSAAKATTFLVYAIVLYAQCVGLGGGIRAAAGMESPWPVRACAVPLVGLGAAIGGAATAPLAGAAAATAATVYTVVMYLNVSLDLAAL